MEEDKEKAEFIRVHDVKGVIFHGFMGEVYRENITGGVLKVLQRAVEEKWSKVSRIKNNL